MKTGLGLAGLGYDQPLLLDKAPGAEKAHG